MTTRTYSTDLQLITAPVDHPPADYYPAVDDHPAVDYHPAVYDHSEVDDHPAVYDHLNLMITLQFMIILS
jgi:hypothetical protein